MSLRRAIDVSVAAVVAIFTAPLVISIALLQIVLVGRPIFFVQQRSGLGGVPFRLIKFRTMHDRRDASGRLLPDDRRMAITGPALRATRLDELPQIWLVLTGKMNLIGPRPLLPETIKAAGQEGELRQRARPGLTGWAQVNGNTKLSDAEKMALDNWYLDNRSLRLDLLILVKTFLVMLREERREPAAIETAYARDPRRGG